MRTLWALIFVILAAPISAQSEYGRVSGFVRDPSDAAIIGAAVTAVHTNMRVGHSTLSGAAGYYSFPSLVPGTYDLTIEYPGFRRLIQEGLVVDAGSNVTLDVSLQIGELTDSLTVTSSQTPLESGMTIRKTIDARDIEELPLNGRNPINFAALKAGVRASRFNSFNPDSLTMGDYNINGSRGDENLITIDGVIALSMRANRTILGTQDTDALAEIQVLTANYLPEYGRSSGGQIRFVTKSGTSTFRGTGYGFFRDEHFDANTWSRNRSPDPAQNSGAAPYAFNQLGFSAGGPVTIGSLNPDRDRLFFFGAGEWIRRLREATTVQTVPTQRMRAGDFSELLDPANPFFGRPRPIIDPRTGEPFPGNIISADRLSRTGLALMNAFPAPTPGFRQGSNNWSGTSSNPSDTRKLLLRLDAPLGANRFTTRYTTFDWTSVDPFRGCCVHARTAWDRPNTTFGATWTRVLSDSAMNELAVGHSLGAYYIDVVRKEGLYRRSAYGIDYPYVLPGKEIDDKIPTISISGFATLDGGPYPASSQGPIWTWSDNMTWLRDRHTIKAGVVVEYSGEDNFDQINVQPVPGDTNNQNGRFEFSDGRPGGTGLGMANAALGLFTSYGEIGPRSFTRWRATSTDVFVQDSWRPRNNFTIEGGLRYVIWPPWTAEGGNAAMFQPAFYDPSVAAVIDPRTGAVLSGDRYNGVVQPGRTKGLPEGFSETHYDVFEPRIGVAVSPDPRTIVRIGAGVFHSRLTPNDSTLLGGNPPVQPRISVSNGLADSPGGAARNEFPLVLTMQDPVFNHPAAYTWSTGIQRELPGGMLGQVDYVGRRGLYLQRERNINQLPAGTIQANPGVNRDALRPFLGFGTIRLSENAARSSYHGLQVSLDRRYRGGLKFGVAYTLSRSMDNASDKRTILFNSYDDRGYWGSSDFDRTHDLKFSYVYEFPFWANATHLAAKILGGWQIAGVIFVQSGQPLSVGTDEDRAGTGDTTAQPYDLIASPRPTGNAGFSAGAGRDDHFWFNPAAFAPPRAGTFGNQPRNLLRGPSFQMWDASLAKTFRINRVQAQIRLEVFNVPNRPNLDNPVINPRSADFGRVITKRSNPDDARNIQFGLRLQF